MIEAKNLVKIPEIRHGFFTRIGGFSKGIYATMNCGLGSGDDRETVLRNREIVATSLGLLPHELITAYQHHSADVITVTEPWGTTGLPRGDALVTNRPHIALAVTTADCVPVLFADRGGRVVGAAHAGWQGALNGVTDNTIDAMIALGARREDICAAVGPAISGKSYEVGPERYQAFVDASAENARFFRQSGRDGHHMLDLPAYVEDRLRRAGIASVERIDRCTYRDEEHFYSFRRATHRGEPDYGRQLSAITLGPQVFVGQDRPA
ncbi:peptidoglycan editing factor PgeF [Rhodoligotrophos defluvii]|uniref:peptidoglycan editing factor PgeF n=1 Tax=Rhodoligotrophos defluvii TaxID=2561934 RepID=UPI0010C9AE1F|nr:peptidoglycan editing factor PgeF [Rhodoligotrophos defluvii]